MRRSYHNGLVRNNEARSQEMSANEIHEAMAAITTEANAGDFETASELAGEMMAEISGFTRIAMRNYLEKIGVEPR